MTTTAIRVETKLLNEAQKVLGTKSRAKAVDVALREIVALYRFKTLMKRHAGRLRFEVYDE